MSRHDGLVVGEPFFVIQFFDREGYFSSCLGRTLAEAREKACQRTLKTLVAFSLPFPGTWSDTNIPDVTLPADFKQALATVDRSSNAED